MPLLLITLLSLILSACNADPTESAQEQPEQKTSQTEPETKTKPSETVAKRTRSEHELALIEHIQNWLNDAEIQLNTLIESSQHFIDSPSQDTLADIKQKFVIAHTDYQLVELAARVLNAENPTIENSIDAHPMLPGYLDSVDGYPNSGLIHSEFALSAETLIEEHQFSDALYLTLGFQPLFFMLNGDTSTPIAPWRRFAEEGTKKHKRAAERRRTFVRLIAQQLKHDISSYIETLRSHIASATLTHEALQAPKLETWLSAKSEVLNEMSIKKIKEAASKADSLMSQKN